RPRLPSLAKKLTANGTLCAFPAVWRRSQRQHFHMQPLTNIAVSAARRAGGLILQYYRRGDTGVIERKGENDYVTEVDKRAEAVIIDAIHRVHPDHAIRAEESGQ